MKTFHPGPQVVSYWERDKAKYLAWNSKWLRFVKKTSIPNSVESLYIKCYNSSSPRPIKSSSSSIRYNSQKICSWSRRPKTILEIRKRPHYFCRWSTVVLLTSFSKTLLVTEKNKAAVCWKFGDCYFLRNFFDALCCNYQLLIILDFFFN